MPTIIFSNPSWDFDQISTGWNSKSYVQLYFHNSEMQRQWNWEVLGKYFQKFPLKGTERVLDYGSGDGKMTAEIARLCSEGVVLGVDISEEMINFAKFKFSEDLFPNLKFEKINSLDFSDFSYNDEYDLICSFCVFHVIGNPIKALGNLKKHLKSDGKLILLIPAGGNTIFFAAAEEILNKYGLPIPWKNAKGVSKKMRTLEGCAECLYEAGYEVISIELVDKSNPYYTKEELISWMIGTTAANWNIPIELSKTLFTELVNRMAELDPTIIDENGRWYFKMNRIHAIAQKPSNI